MLGEEKSVHFQAVEPGSTRLACEVEHEATYKVYKRVARAPSADARTPEGRAYRHIEHLLREDSAGARLNRNKENVIDFPRSQRQESSAIKLTQQKISHVGTLVGIGGRDATAHAMLLNAEGTHWSFIVDRALARRLSGYLYGAPIRLIGEGTRERDERGDWSEKDLKATHFEVLKDVGWNEAIRSVRDLGGGWSEDAMETVAFLREDD